MNFFDPKLDSKGEPYSIKQYRNIVKDRYILSKRCGISYTDSGKMTPTERRMILELLRADLLEESTILKKN